MRAHLAFTKRFRLDLPALEYSLNVIAHLEKDDKVRLDSGGLLQVERPFLFRGFARWLRGDCALMSMAHIEYIILFGLDLMKRPSALLDSERGRLIKLMMAVWNGLRRLQQTYHQDATVVYKAAACLRAIQVGLDDAVQLHQRKREAAKRRATFSQSSDSST